VPQPPASVSMACMYVGRRLGWRSPKGACGKRDSSDA
jgi:hypothetical protein